MKQQATSNKQQATSNFYIFAKKSKLYFMGYFNKNEQAIYKIYVCIFIIFFITLIILSILGHKKRTACLSEIDLNITETLSLNNLSDVKEQFIYNYEIDTEAIKNYIYTNSSITNYIYSFKIKYSSKIFKNSDIYKSYINTNKIIKDNNFIKEINTQNLNSTKIIEFHEIDNIEYFLKVNPIYYFILIFLLLLLIYMIFSKKIENIMTYKLFIIITIILAFILLLIRFWIGYPGYFSNPDNIGTMIESVNGNYTHWHPIIIKASLNFLYKIFGYNVFYLFLINIICWYAGISIIIIALFYKFRKKEVIFLFLLSFVGTTNTYLYTQLKDVTCSMYLWLAYSLILFTILVNIDKKYISIILYTIICLLLLLGLLWRHNAIVTIYPIFIYFSYLILKNKKIIKKYILSFISLMILFGLLLISIYKFHPYIFINDKKQLSKEITNTTFLLQIAGCAVPSDDGSLIPDDWYMNGKNFNDMKYTYLKNKTLGDNLGASWVIYRPFKSGELKDIKIVWVKYIIKHPLNYIKHIFNFFRETVNSDVHWRIKSTDILPEPLEKLNVFHIAKVPFDKQRIELYNIFNNYFKININILFFLAVMFLISFITIYLILKYKYFNNLTLFICSTSFSAIATFFIVILFSPAIDNRYIFPITPISIISVISFITFIYDIGGIKKLLLILKRK